MIDIHPTLVLVDGGLHDLWKQAIQHKYTDTGVVVVELSSATPTLRQLESVFKAHPGVTAIQVFAQTTRSIWEGVDPSGGWNPADIRMPPLTLGATTYDTYELLVAQIRSALHSSDVLIRTDGLWNGSYTFVMGATAGDDRFEVADTVKAAMLNGLEGLDTVHFSGSADDYHVTPPSPVPHMMAGALYLGAMLVSGNGGTHALFNMDRLEFNDRSTALDLDDGDAANTALRFLTAIAGKAALQNQALIGEAIAYADAFETGDLAQWLIDAGVLAQFAGGSSDADLVKLLYANIAGQPASAAELQWTLDFAAHNGFTQADILEFAVGLSQNAPQALLTGQPGIDYLPYELF